MNRILIKWRRFRDDYYG